MTFEIEELAAAAARAFWSCAWADWYQLEGGILSGCEVLDVMPPVPAVYEAHGLAFIKAVLAVPANIMAVASAVHAAGLEDEAWQDACGRGLAMEAMGHGVAWLDGDHAVVVPYREDFGLYTGDDGLVYCTAGGDAVGDIERPDEG